ncbi:MAG TPA: hypothetical protein VHO24_04615 [Opitutaceae bacterium]|nr:hypothetical protein [Opitutaceae bacterium]
MRAAGPASSPEKFFTKLELFFAGNRASGRYSFVVAPLRAGVVCAAQMKNQDYRTMLRAVEQALEICDQSTGLMDEIHRKICEDLRDARARLLRLVGTTPRPESM